MIKRVAIAGILVLLGGRLALAAPAPPAERAGKGRPGGPQAGPALSLPRGRGMAEELGLTAAQKEKIEAITKEFAAKMKAIAGDRLLTEGKKREKGMPLYQEMRRRIEAALTPQQRQKIKARQERSAAEGRRREEEFVKELGLNEAQKKKLMAIQNRLRAQFAQIEKSTSLSWEQKREKMKGLGEQAKKEREAVLTPAQRQKAEAMMKRQGEEWRKRMDEARKRGTRGPGAPASGRK